MNQACFIFSLQWLYMKRMLWNAAIWVPGKQAALLSPSSSAWERLEDGLLPTYPWHFQDSAEKGEQPFTASLRTEQWDSVTYKRLHCSRGLPMWLSKVPPLKTLTSDGLELKRELASFRFSLLDLDLPSALLIPSEQSRHGSSSAHTMTLQRLLY